MENTTWSNGLSTKADWNYNDYEFANGTHNDTHDNQDQGQDAYYDDYYYPYDDNYIYEELIIEGFPFEKPIYLYVWTILVLLTTVFNTLVIIVLLRKKMRNSTNTILTALALSDLLTGFVTLPTYIYVYWSHEEFRNTISAILTEEWCEAFFISRYYVSKTFHTISVWLTLLLGLQRFVYVWLPMMKMSLFSKRNTLLMILSAFVLAPFLHIYHIFKKKAVKTDGTCRWTIEDPCKESCIYLWLSFLLMHFLPCIVLVVLTLLVISKLRSTRGQRSSNLVERDEKSRRASAIVIVIVVIFLLAEIPYGMFLLISVSLRHDKKNLLPLKDNRTFHCVYEIVLVLGFLANFWVYTLMNKKFRDSFKKTFIVPVRNLYYAISGKEHWNRVAETSQSSMKTQESELMLSRNTQEMQPMQNMEAKTI